MRSGRTSWWLVVAITLVVATTACHEEGDVRVLSLDIEGNEALAAEAIQEVMVTTAGGRLPWSPHIIFDREAFEQDLERIRQLYDARGYPEARVSELEAELNEEGEGVRLRIGITEGEPVRLDAVRYLGLDELSSDLQAAIHDTAPETGVPRIRAGLTEAQRETRELLLNNGYAYASVDLAEQSGSTPGTVTALISVTPGPSTVFGPIRIVGNSNVDDNVLRRHITFAPGEMYRQNAIVQSERRLASIEMLRFVDIDARSIEDPLADPVPVTVTISEDPPRRVELRGGYGTEDRLRGSIEWSHLNFIGGLRQFTALARWSSIDRGVRLGFTQPYFGRSGLSLDAGASNWWTSEDIYSSDVTGGRLGLSYRFGEGAETQGARSPADVVRVAYVFERMRYTVRPEVLEDLTNVETLIALGLDPVSGAGRGTKAAIAADYQRSATDNLADPTRGYGLSASWEESRPAFGGTFAYRKLTAEGRGYLPIASTVVALRVRGGSIIADSDADAPFSERYFLGGSTSLRGWGRFQVSPLRDGIPVGGRTVADGSLELRFPVTGPVGAVVFVDAGNVWSGSLAATAGTLRTNAGAGVRYTTPIGVVRADIGYQLNPIEGLVVNGEPESRRWRLHLSIGQAF